MKTNRIVAFILGVVAPGLQVPGILMLVFNSGGVWNTAAIISAVLAFASGGFQAGFIF